MDIWHSAQPDREVAQNGWLGRYFDNTCAGCDPHVGVAMGQQLPLAMHGERILPLAFERTESYRYTGKDQEHYAQLNKLEQPLATSRPSEATPTSAKPQTSGNRK